MFERLKAVDRQTRIILILAGIIGILVFGAVTGSIRQAGWNEGYLAGLLTNGSATIRANPGESARAVTPNIGPQTVGPQTVGPQAVGPQGYYGHHGWGGHGFGFVGGFFRFLFFGFLLITFFKFLGFWRWRMHGGHPRHHHQHGPWGQQGPWGHQQGQPYGQQPNQPQAEPSGQPTPSPTQPDTNTPQPTSWVRV